MIKKTNLLLLAFLVLTSCKKEDFKLAIDFIAPCTIFSANVYSPTEKKKEFDFSLIKIDSINFYNLQSQAIPKEEKIEKITDYKTAKKMLEGKVFFSYDREMSYLLKGENLVDNPGWEYLDKFILPTGEVVRDTTRNSFFVAYFPSENILLLENGRSLDRAFNLKNGKKIEEVGNPNYNKTSPNALFRLTGYFPGQLCTQYLIQCNKQNEYKKILSVNDLYSEALDKKKELCTMNEIFWSDDHTLNFYTISFKSGNLENVSKEYYQLRILPIKNITN